MIKKTITYLDYNDVERTEDFYFNLTEVEAMEMEVNTAGGLSATIEKISAEKDMSAIIKILKEFVLRAYGEKSPDGRRFIKSKELSEEFSQTEAYSKLFMELATNEGAGVEFVNGILSSIKNKPALSISQGQATKSALVIE